jgi:ABC-type Fe3+-hydroxamate transport system substrate-binding protein
MKGFVALFVLSTLALGGCASGQLLAMNDDPPAPKVVVHSDTFCRQVSKVDASGKRVFAATWDVNDTPATVQGIEQIEARYRSVCEKKIVARK